MLLRSLTTYNRVAAVAGTKTENFGINVFPALTDLRGGLICFFLQQVLLRILTTYNRVAAVAGTKMENFGNTVFPALTDLCKTLVATPWNCAGRY